MLITAFFMGLAGSLHCAAMCGPLALAVPAVGSTRFSFLTGRVIYHLGRVAVYAVLGLVFGAIGKSLMVAGFQRWLSVGTGTAMLAFLILGLNGIKSPFEGGSLWIKAIFRKHLNRRSCLAAFILGATNGLLPCGLVYMAATASLASGELLRSALFMVVFGLGTWPMMLGIALSGPVFRRFLPRIRIKNLMPIAVTVVALSLILRGLSLGIPYLSPANADGTIACPSCRVIEP